VSRMRRSWRVSSRAIVIAFLAMPFLVEGSAAHIRYSGSCGDAYCEYFNGSTVEDEDINQEVDPINIVWYQYGSWDPNVRVILEQHFGANEQTGTFQRNRRLVGDPGNWHYDWARQTSQRKVRPTGCCAGWHWRIFLGHTHINAIDNWSVSDAHHEDAFDNVDRSFQEAEEYTREREAVVYGNDTKANWTYLPRADRCWGTLPAGIQNCYNGWPARIRG
jgi:hypothetical protein